MSRSSRPLVGITCDIADSPNGERAFSYRTYARALIEVGGLPLALPHDPALIPDILATIDALVLTGGDDPRTEPFGVPTDPRVTPVHPDRQAFESALIKGVLDSPDGGPPTLGVCLGMQMMALHAGGALDQHMPDRYPDAARHWGADHDITPAHDSIPAGVVHSRHRQAVTDPGSLVVAAESPDGVIEAVIDRGRAFYLGVQWHPERTDGPLGQPLFHLLVQAARLDARSPA